MFLFNLWFIQTDFMVFFVLNLILFFGLVILFSYLFRFEYLSLPTIYPRLLLLLNISIFISLFVFIIFINVPWKQNDLVLLYRLVKLNNLHPVSLFSHHLILSSYLCKSFGGFSLWLSFLLANKINYFSWFFVNNKSW